MIRMCHKNKNHMHVLSTYHKIVNFCVASEAKLVGFGNPHD